MFTSVAAVQDALPGFRVGVRGTSTAGGSPWAATQRYANLIPGVALGVAPGAPGATCDRSTPGALLLPPDPGGGHGFRIARARTTCEPSGNHCWIVTDRLVECACDPSLSTVQALNTVALPARAPSNGVGVQMTLETGAATSGSGTPTIAIAYTNEQGQPSSTTLTFPGSWNSGPIGSRQPPIPLAAGDQGVQSVQSLQITSPALTAGNILYLVLYIPIIQLDGYWRTEQATPFGGELEDYFDTAFAPVDPNACLDTVVTTALTTAWGMELDLVID